MGDRIAVMNDGRLEQVGTPEELYERPANRFVAGFIGSPAMSFADGRRRGRRAARVGASGSRAPARAPPAGPCCSACGPSTCAHGARTRAWPARSRDRRLRRGARARDVPRRRRRGRRRASSSASRGAPASSRATGCRFGHRARGRAAVRARAAARPSGRRSRRDDRRRGPARARSPSSPTCSGGSAATARSPSWRRGSRAEPPPLVRLAAHGTSDNAATYGVYAFGRLAGRTALRDSISLPVYDGVRLGARGELAIALSQSGETPDVVAWLEAMGAGRRATVAITNDPGSPLARAACGVSCAVRGRGAVRRRDQDLHGGARRARAPGRARGRPRAAVDDALAATPSWRARRSRRCRRPWRRSPRRSPGPGG